MPKELTHWILAERALAGLETNGRIGEIIRSHHELYLAGAVLPDSLLHLFRGPDAGVALALANDFHDAGGNSYAPLIRVGQRFSAAATLPEWLLACLLGVLAHMQGDIVFHPYVFAVAGSSDVGRHYRMETAIDVYMLRSGAGVPARHLRTLVTPHIREQLTTTGSLLFDPQERLQPSSMRQALDLHCRFQAMYDRTCLKLLVRLLGSLPGSPLADKQHLFYPLRMSQDDPMIIKSETWIHPVSGNRQTTTIDELADQSVLRTIEVFNNIGQQDSLANALSKNPGENLLTGMSGVKQLEMKNFIDSGAGYGDRQQKIS